MAKKAGKAKSRKVAVRKPAVRKQAPRAPKPQAPATAPAAAAPAAAHLDAPGAVEHPAADQSSGVTKSQAKQASKQRVALVSKGGDKVPVQVKDDEHLARLRAEHGEGNVEVQS